MLSFPDISRDEQEMTHRTCVTTVLLLAVTFSLWTIDTADSTFFVVVYFLGASTAVAWLGVVLGTALWLPIQLYSDRILNYKGFVVTGTSVTFFLLVLARI